MKKILNRSTGNIQRSHSGNNEREAVFSFTKGLINDLFTVFFLLFIILTIMELFSPLSVSFFFNTDILLDIVAAVGVLMILCNCMEPVVMQPEKDSVDIWAMLFIGAVSIVSMLFIRSFTLRMGRVAYPIGVGIGAMIYIILMQSSIFTVKNTGLDKQEESSNSRGRFSRLNIINKRN